MIHPCQRQLMTVHQQAYLVDSLLCIAFGLAPRYTHSQPANPLLFVTALLRQYCVADIVDTMQFHVIANPKCFQGAEVDVWKMRYWKTSCDVGFWAFEALTSRKFSTLNDTHFADAIVAALSLQSVQAQAPFGQFHLNVCTLCRITSCN